MDNNYCQYWFPSVRFETEGLMASDFEQSPQSMQTFCSRLKAPPPPQPSSILLEFEPMSPEWKKNYSFISTEQFAVF